MAIQTPPVASVAGTPVTASPVAGLDLLVLILKNAIGFLRELWRNLSNLVSFGGDESRAAPTARNPTHHILPSQLRDAPLVKAIEATAEAALTAGDNPQAAEGQVQCLADQTNRALQGRGTPNYGACAR